MKKEKNRPLEVQVMAIINVTPDSFYDGSRTMADEQISQRVKTALDEGAAILDLGGYSTRPGADDISPEEEFSRLDRAFSIIKAIAPDTPISVDTFRSRVVERLFNNWGSFTVNDISAGELDKQMIPLVGKLKLPYIAMHSRGTPQTMQTLTHYDDIVREVREFFEVKINECLDAGIGDLTIDPGFGFAKTVKQNFELLAEMNQLISLGYPILAGLSRKSMIWRTLGSTPADALNGTTALNWEAMRQGAAILRVHDVREAVEISKLFYTFGLKR